MKEINNIEKFRNFMHFPDAESFYYIEIIKRRKDSGNISLPRDSKAVKSFYIYENQLLSKSQEIIDLCITNNARAYAWPNVRNSFDIALKMLNEITYHICHKETTSLMDIYNSTCGKYHSEEKKIWVVDIDTEDLDIVAKYYELMQECRGFQYVENSENFFKTLHGYHILSHPFDVSEFNDKCLILNLPRLDIHKDNPTLIYFKENEI